MSQDLWRRRDLVAGAGWAADARIELERDFLAPIRGRAREAGKTLQALALLVHDAQRDCA